MIGSVEFRILGPLEVWVAGDRLRLRGPRQAKALAALLLDAGRVVTIERVIEAVWDEPPATARRQIQDLVPDLRRELAGRSGRDVISTDKYGYILSVDVDELDALRFEALVAAAREARVARPAVAAEAYRAALALCRGPTLAGVESRALEPAIASWEERRLTVLEECLAVEMAAGGREGLLGELRTLVAQNPLRERPAELLMRALSHEGDRLAALEVYRQLRRRLADGTGLDPSRALQDIHQAILRDKLDCAGPPRVVPAQLPPDLPGFAGRAAELGLLENTLGRHPTAIVISALSGTAGVGKTTLAVHWAHQVRHRFPDGQLYVNLRGFDPDGRAMAPAEAVHGFLQALGVPPGQIPADLDAQAALYRSHLAGKRTLVVLDNARDVGQVRPLLPGSPTALVLVTSRHQLTGLVAIGARPLLLDVLSDVESRELLTRRLGPERVAAEPAAVDRIVTACARLPLALAVAAARAQQTGFPLAAVAAELDDGRLDALDTGDPESQLRAVFSWSYTALAEPAARLFRLLGLCPGRDISTAAVASLAGVRVPEARGRLSQLARANLLAEPAPGRFTFHDLLRAYAGELARHTDAEDLRHDALQRLLSHYTHTAHAADRLLHPLRDPMALPLAPPPPDTSAEPLADEPAAAAWLAAEQSVLLAVARAAADRGFDVATWQLAWAIDTFVDRRGQWTELTTVWEAALAAADRLAHPGAQAYAHRRLAHLDTRRGEHARAHEHHRCALDLYARAGDPIGQAHTHHNLAILRWRQGFPADALDHARQARELFLAAGHEQGTANALNDMGFYLTEVGDHGQALVYCEQALTLFQRLGYRSGEAASWDSLGYAHHHLGDHGRAVDCFQQALTLFRDVGDRYEEATTATRLGDAYQAAGRPDAATGAWRRALDILEVLDHADAEALRARLDPSADR